MYYVIGKPRQTSLSQTRYHGSYDEITLTGTIKYHHAKCEKKRQVLVHEPEEEIHYEPYMTSLQQEYCEPSTECDSKVELPWKDIALPRTGIKIHGEIKVPLRLNNTSTSSRKKSKSITPTGQYAKDTMELPWDDLVIADCVDAQWRQETKFPSDCDSSVTIPWDDLAFDKPGQITSFHQSEKCTKGYIEMPWDEIMIPSDVIIKSKIIKKRHPSNNVKQRRSHDISTFICHTNCQCDNIRTRKRNDA